MQANFKARFWRLFRWGTIVFCTLFIFRLLYGYLATSPASSGGEESIDYFDQMQNLRKNYASEKGYRITSTGGQPDFSTNQKYEKTAIVKTKSSEFGKDEDNIRKKVTDFKALIQYEKALGKKGYRELHLMIGVNPEKFDSFSQAIQGIGTIASVSVTKVDKTNDYRQLNAEKISLEKTIASLESLKQHPDGVTSLLSVYDRQLELEDRLQNLGVDLGNFNTENEFCTVKLSLYEGAAARSVSFIHRVKIALQWTLHYFAYAVFGFVGLSILVFVLLLIIDKLNVLNILK